MKKSNNKIVPQASGQLTTMETIATIPEEAIWLASRKSARTRRAYRDDVRKFMATFNITTQEQLRQVDQRSVMLWEQRMREEEKLEASTVRRRLAALSSLFTHLVKFDVVDQNPVKDVERPAINRREGITPAFSASQARKLLDAPDATSLLGIRDRAILSVALHVGIRRSEIAILTVGDMHDNQGFNALRVRRKGGKRGNVIINTTTKNRIIAYLEKSGHGGDLDAPLFLPVKGNRKGQEERRHLDSVGIYRMVRKYAAKVGIPDKGYGAHSTRATFITEALRNGATIEDVQAHVGHADISTTKLYDRRRMNPEKSPSFYVNY